MSFPLLCSLIPFLNTVGALSVSAQGIAPKLMFFLCTWRPQTAWQTGEEEPLGRDTGLLMKSQAFQGDSCWVICDLA